MQFLISCFLLFVLSAVLDYSFSLCINTMHLFCEVCVKESTLRQFSPKSYGSYSSRLQIGYGCNIDLSRQFHHHQLKITQMPLKKSSNSLTGLISVNALSL